MAFAQYIESGGKRLRCGYTTGTCAALAAAGATRLLLTGIPPDSLQLMTPRGFSVDVTPVQCRRETDWAECAVCKDGGDDIDATADALIFARVLKTDTPGVHIDGGRGVGRVTRPGLDQPVGAAAINRVPRRMIGDAVAAVCNALGYGGGISVVISVPAGADIAEKTFNPKLGIQGGISILGTSGIVEPMSVRALVDTKKLELHQAALTSPARVLLTPGNYGLDFLDSHPMGGDVPVVVCSNFIGDLLDACGAEGFGEVLLVGHIGKLVKLAGGIFNTHSRVADCRTELFCAHAAVCGADAALCRALLDAATADACIELLQKASLWEPVLTRLLTAIETHLLSRAAGQYAVGAVLFSNTYGRLGATKSAEEMLPWS
ncbi:MAG: cobalt-precorrin-5B (C(1))-methyltransferase CbiD [Oscillospiraceae bacterium]